MPGLYNYGYVPLRHMEHCYENLNNNNLDNSSKLNVQHRAAVVVALELENQHQLLIAIRLLE